MMSEQGYARLRGVLRRRRRWTLSTGGTVLALALLSIKATPPVYRASAILRALESQPHKDYVAPTVVEQTGERLKTLRLSVMARPLIEAITGELHLDQAFHVSREEAVEEMRRRLEVKVEGEDTFLLTYEDSDAARAREVVDRVASRFVARQLEQRAETAAVTERALAAEVTRLAPDVQRLEQAIRRYRAEHNGSLPEQQEGNLRALDQSTLEINILVTNLDLNEERRRQQILGAMSPMRHQEALLTTALHDARTHYTAEHPEVRRIASELEEVRRMRLADEDKRHADLASDPEVAALSREIDHERASIAALRRRQDEVRARLADMATNGDALARLGTELEVARNRYLGASAKLREAELAAAVERGMKDLRYENVETAARPLHPIRPNKPLLALGAVLLAVILGVGAGFARDFADGAIHAPEELGTFETHAEVLACVPDIPALARSERQGAPVTAGRRRMGPGRGGADGGGSKPEDKGGG